MYPYLYNFGSKIPTYVVMAGMGLMASSFLAGYLLYEKSLVGKYSTGMLCALPGVVLGGKMLGILSICFRYLYQIGEFRLKESVEQAGIVFYGGLLGYILCSYMICKIRKQDFAVYSTLIAIGAPLFHFFGRIGCFLGGCCYGIESETPIAFAYKVIDQQKVVKRIPVALIEAAFELSIFGLIFYQYRKTEKKDAVGKQAAFKVSFLEQYLILYAMFRLIIEVWRGDEIRGVFWGISFSQIISIGILAVIILQKRKML
ncbi:MAG TPA: prolipoprotein diacylglyceryl transferase [Candidatus Blautia faecipullorum]|nr:prolipoprotein diacylglyceryl transferase [Candidatus Blautia faecipullorum]